jgi:hypothetical protein
MNLGKTLTDLATAPVRVGLAATQVGLGVVGGAINAVQRNLRGTNPMVGGSVSSIFGLNDAMERANRLSRLIDDDAPLGRALAPNGPLNRLLQPGGIIDQLTTEGGLLDRMTAENGPVTRALAPGGIIDKLSAEDGLLDRLTADDGPIARALQPEGLVDQVIAEGGLVDRLTHEDGALNRVVAPGGLIDQLLAENGLLDVLASERSPLLKLADVADTLGALAPTINQLHDAVLVLSDTVNPLSKIAGRIPLGRQRSRRTSTRAVASDRVIDAEE